MIYKELSILDVIKDSKQLAMSIKEDFQVIICVSKGGFMLGLELAKILNLPLLEIVSQRTKLSLVKKFGSSLLIILPKFLKVRLRKWEIKHNVHAKDASRNISFDETKWQRYKTEKNILIIDDSIDYGYTMQKVLEVVNNFFTQPNIKILTLNYMDFSFLKPDYYLYTNHMISYPLSEDNRDYKKFLEIFKQYHRKKDFPTF